MKVTLLGTGTPSPSLKRASSGYLIDVGSDLIVMDHGPGAHHRLLETGKRAVDVTHVFLSHLHYDHCLDYLRLVLQRWDIGADRIPELVVYGPPATQRMTDLLVGPEGAFAPDITARIKHQGSIDIFEARGGQAPRKWPVPKVQEVRPGDVIQGNGWTVRVGEASHVQPYLDCYGYRIDSAGRSICYSGDSGGIAPGIVELARGCDVLIHMCHYYTGTEPTKIYRAVCGNHIDTARVAAKSGAKMLVLTHMLEQIDQPGMREKIVKEISAIYDGTIIWGEDLMEIPLEGARLAKME
jgi:ribonuclease BN (tRNA processing enzyme)